jgi:hypothetical protein
MRQNKAKREIPLKLHNEEAHLLQKQTIKLMLLADDEDEDMEVLKMLASQEERQSSLFRDILSEIASQASGMAPERAKSLHDNLLKLADVLSRRQQAMRSYTCLGKVIISADSNSRFETIDISPASEVVKVANALASVAKTAVVAVHGGN